VTKLLLAAIGGYVLGSIPMAYLAGRWRRGIDIRQVGTGSVGGSNVHDQVGRWLIVVVGLLDIGKAALATWLGQRYGGGPTAAVIAGLAAVVGHCWPWTLGFHGGRGLSTCLGVLVVLFPMGALAELLALAVGRLFRHPAVNLLALPALSLLGWGLGEPSAIIALGSCMFLIVSLKRLEANRQPLPAGPERWRVLGRRWWLDRDIRDWEAWVSRRPEASQSNPLEHNRGEQTGSRS
jgi:glycerol-3-phosphate acyltransferase PlsY